MPRRLRRGLFTIISTQFANLAPAINQISIRASQTVAIVSVTTGNQLYTIGRQVLQVFRGGGEAGIRAMMEAGRRLNPADVQTQADFLRSMNYGSFSGIRAALNNALNGGPNNFTITWRGQPAVAIQWHHLVERRPTNIIAHGDGFGINAINSMRNLMPTPIHIHQAITSYYTTNGAANSWLPAGSQNLRAYMTSQTWQRQYEIGLKIWQYAMEHNGDLSSFRP